MANTISTTSSTLAGSLSSPGVGSGLDVNSIVSQLISATRAGPDKIYSNQTTQANAQISALGTVKSALSKLQDSLTALSSTGTLNNLSAQSSDSTLFTTAADSTATSGSYSLEVLSLATAAKSASTAYASASTSVGQGTVTITLGSSSFSVTLGSGADSLSNLVSAINNASDNPGVNATIVTDVNGAHLMLTSTKTGAANALSLSSSSASGGSPFMTMNAISGAADAHIKVDGFDAYSASNAVTTAISGLTINLAQAKPGTQALLTVAPDASAVTQTVQDFVTSYNAVLSAITKQTKADPTGKNPGPLVGDSGMRNLLNKLRLVVGGEVSGTGSQWTLLSQLGITSNTDGSLKLDTAKLGAAVQSDIGSVQKLFSNSTSGLAAQLTTILKPQLQTGGTLDSSTDNLNAQLKDIAKQQDLLNTRMDALQARYLAEFNALDTLMATMKTTSNYLTQQLSNLPGFTTKG